MGLLSIQLLTSKKMKFYFSPIQKWTTVTSKVIHVGRGVGLSVEMLPYCLFLAMNYLSEQSNARLPLYLEALFPLLFSVQNYILITDPTFAFDMDPALGCYKTPLSRKFSSYFFLKTFSPLPASYYFSQGLGWH